MKKTAKNKKAAPAKKAAKKTAKKPAKLMAKAKKKSPVKAKAKPKAKTKAKSKGLSIVELFEMKKQHEEQVTHADPHTHEAPPHELHDKVGLQEKPKGNTKLA
ncbi:MAG: hypothetical protein ACXWQO_10305, partial [Bdellovibrionota bacterium]